MIARIPIDHDQIAAFCQRWNITELALFGSVLREDFDADSDVDVLITLPEGDGRTLIDLGRMELELAEIIGRKVDLWTRKGVEQSRNPTRKRDILSTAQVIHVR
jgi:predicted nucleotidyltransferase